MVLFIATILILTTLRPALGPKGPVSGWRRARAGAPLAALPLILLVVITIGGIYGGIFSVTEAAAVGAFLAILYGWSRAPSPSRPSCAALKDSVSTTAVVMLILIAAHVFGPFLALSHVPHAGGRLPDVAAHRAVWRAGPDPVHLSGARLLHGRLCHAGADHADLLSGHHRTGFDPIWFGVVVVVMLEMGLITPPVGINVFIVKSVAPKVELSEIFRGVWPFLLAMVLLVALLILFPQIALILPNTMLGAV
jgi:TRAP-type C4-dicarboxylate transport system permease large subunit